MRSILFLCLIIPVVGISQSNKTDNGIKFVTGLSWQEVQAKARAENKFIFMDCYATWCGPCRFMADSIFTQKEVGEYMNNHFISVAVQADQTSKDANDIRKWYEDAKSIVKEYSINSLPTYLFFSPDGQPVHKFQGATGRNSANFIAKAKDALDPEKQYYTLVGNYKMHEDDSAFLRRALVYALNTGDMENAENIGNAYTNRLQNNYTVGDLILMMKALQSSGDKAFYLIMNNAYRIDSTLQDPGAAEVRICNIITQEYMGGGRSSENRSPIVWAKMADTLKSAYPQLNSFMMQLLFDNFERRIIAKEIHPIYKNGAPPANWEEIYKQIRKNYPDYDPERVIVLEKPDYYAAKKMWPECMRSSELCLTKFEKQLNTSRLNTICWYVFLHSTDKDLLFKASQLLRKKIPDESDKEAYNTDGTYTCIDTYANLLYKLGDRENGIFWEKKAYDLAKIFKNPDSRDLATQNTFKITMERMQKGMSTWEGRDEDDNFQ